MAIINIASYKFVALDELDVLREQLLTKCEERNLMGTILLGHEGINLILAGERADIDAFTTFLTSYAAFADMAFKESESKEKPFRRMRVRLKQEIVTMRVEGADPTVQTGKHLPVKTFKQWLDEGRDITLIDTRNDYEVQLGSFDNAIDFSIHEFNQFPKAIADSSLDRKKTMVMFCTGGIRCEKASIAALDAGFTDVYQVQDGILKYFEDCGGEHYHGDCFVFDRRCAITPELKETGLTQCPRCDHFIPLEEQQHPKYQAWQRCQYCSDSSTIHNQE